VSSRLKFSIATGVFAIGALMILYIVINVSHFELLIPGFILVGLAGPATYYFYAKLKSSYTKSTDEELLRRAQIESTLKGKAHAKK
jgi:hypothetical protein